MSEEKGTGMAIEPKWNPRHGAGKGLKRPPVHKTGVKKRRGDVYSVASRRNARYDKALRAFEAEVGRERILDALLIAQDEDKRIKELVVQMLMPIHRRTSFAKLTANVGISLGEYLDITRRAFKKLGVASAAHHLPGVIRDIALDSYSTLKPCWKCNGVPAEGEEPCNVCNGTGTLRQAGDKDSRQVFLELEGVLSRKGGVEINNNQISVSGGPGSFEAIIAKRDEAMEAEFTRED